MHKGHRCIGDLYALRVTVLTIHMVRLE